MTPPDKNQLILFNPRSAWSKYRIPNSILQVGASITSQCNYIFIDGNMEQDAWAKIDRYLSTGLFKYFGTTVMPGPQLHQAIPIASEIKKKYPAVIQIWGGYFPSNHYRAVLTSGYVDYIIDGPGDQAFPLLLKALEKGQPLDLVPNLIFKTESGEIVRTPRAELMDQDALPPLPYDYFDTFYPLKTYLAPTVLGSRTMAYHSSMGCPFKCAFCAVVPIYNARWKGKSAKKIYDDLIYLKEKYKINAIEFHDNNFFVAEKRVAEFSSLIAPHQISWWGEARIDTVDQYTDATLQLMHEAGCKMIFFGAESGDDQLLSLMDKGGKQTSAQIIRFAERIKKFDIIPEFSFVLGFPGSSQKIVEDQINAEINFIKKIKKINPAAEIIIYIYSPVPTEGSSLYQEITNQGFKFPKTLEGWLEPQWTNFDLRKNPLTPWLNSRLIRRIQNFETVLNAYFPTISDIKLTRWQRKIISAIAALRYHLSIYAHPYELKLLLKYWLRYRQPQDEGF